MSLFTEEDEVIPNSGTTSTKSSYSCVVAVIVYMEGSRDTEFYLMDIGTFRNHDDPEVKEIGSRMAKKVKGRPEADIVLSWDDYRKIGEISRKDLKPKAPQTVECMFEIWVGF